MAAEYGQLQILEWARAQDPPCPWTTDAIEQAERAGHTEVVRWLREHGCPDPADDTDDTAEVSDDTKGTDNTDDSDDNTDDSDDN